MGDDVKLTRRGDRFPRRARLRPELRCPAASPRHPALRRGSAQRAHPQRGLLPRRRDRSGCQCRQGQARVPRADRDRRLSALHRASRRLVGWRVAVAIALCCSASADASLRRAMPRRRRRRRSTALSSRATPATTPTRSSWSPACCCTATPDVPRRAEGDRQPVQHGPVRRRAGPAAHRQRQVRAGDRGARSGRCWSTGR